MRTDTIRSGILNNYRPNFALRSPAQDQQMAREIATASPFASIDNTRPSVWPWRGTIKLIALSALWTMMTFNPAFGQAWLFQPSLELQEEYNDNFGLDTESSDSGFATIFSPKLEVSRLTEIWQFRGYGQLDAVRYSNEDLDNSNSYLFGFSSAYRKELGQWRLDGSYRHDTLFRDIANIVVAPEGISVAPSDVDVSVSRVPVKRDRLLLNPSWSGDITERTRFRLGYRFNDVSYDETSGSDLVDFRDHTITGQIFRDLSEKDTINTSIELTKYRAPDEDREFTSYALLVGLDHEFSEMTSGGFRAGVRRTSFDTPEDDGSDTGFLAGIYGRRRLEEKGFLDARLERVLNPSGEGGLVQTDQLALRANRELSPRLSVLLQARAFRTESLGNLDAGNNRRYFEFEPTLRWYLTEQWSIDTSYNYTREKRDDRSQSADSNAVFVTLSYEPLGLPPAPRF